MDKMKNWKERVGWGGIAAMAAMGFKVLLFYRMMGIQSNLLLVWAMTACFISLLFALFHNKWIPASIYLVLSVLMFADAAYASFFNRYLSVNMLGAAGFLGDIGASLKVVLKPKFFLLFGDNVLIFSVLAERWGSKKRDSSHDL